MKTLNNLVVKVSVFGKELATIFQHFEYQHLHFWLNCEVSFLYCFELVDGNEITSAPIVILFFQMEVFQ